LSGLPDAADFSFVPHLGSPPGVIVGGCGPGWVARWGVNLDFSGLAAAMIAVAGSAMGWEMAVRFGQSLEITEGWRSC